MGKILRFQHRPTRQMLKLKTMADGIDYVIKENLKDNVPLLDIVGLAAHRLGKLIRSLDIEERKFYYFKITELLKKYAEIEDSPKKGKAWRGQQDLNLRNLD